MLVLRKSVAPASNETVPPHVIRRHLPQVLIRGDNVVLVSKEVRDVKVT